MNLFLAFERTEFELLVPYHSDFELSDIINFLYLNFRSLNFRPLLFLNFQLSIPYPVVFELSVFELLATFSFGLLLVDLYVDNFYDFRKKGL